MRNPFKSAQTAGTPLPLSTMNSLALHCRNAGGEVFLIPANSTAKLFAELIGLSFISRRALKIIKKLGYKVEIQ